MGKERVEYRVVGTSKEHPEQGERRMFPVTESLEVARFGPRQYVAANYTGVRIQRRTVVESDWEDVADE